MKCSCGYEFKEGEKFCTNCGKSIESNVSPVSEVVQKKKTSGLSIASMVIGILCIISCFAANVLIIPLALIGLILGCVSKPKNGYRTTGIVLNTLSMVISIVVLVLFITIFAKVLNSDESKNFLIQIYNIISSSVSDNYIAGKYNCADYYSSTGEYIVRFELDKDNNFLWGKYGDTANNYVKGKYTLEKLDKRYEQYSYFKLVIDGDEYYYNGVKQDEVYRSEYELAITEDINTNKKHFAALNSKTMNMYYCDEE